MRLPDCAALPSEAQDQRTDREIPSRGSPTLARGSHETPDAWRACTNIVRSTDPLLYGEDTRESQHSMDLLHAVSPRAPFPMCRSDQTRALGVQVRDP